MRHDRFLGQSLKTGLGRLLRVRAGGNSVHLGHNRPPVALRHPDIGDHPATDHQRPPNAPRPWEVGCLVPQSHAWTGPRLPGEESIELGHGSGSLRCDGLRPEKGLNS